MGLAALLAAVILAACGGDSEPEKAPRIPAGVAKRLANLSDETAADLEAGDDCAAQEAADELEREALEAEKEIPEELRSEVREGVEKLTADIECTPVTVVETVPEETTPEEPCLTEDELKELEEKRKKLEEERKEREKEGPGKGHAYGRDKGPGKDDEPPPKCDEHGDEGDHGGEGD